MSLADVGLLSSTSQSRYRLGWRFLDLGETLKASLNLRGAAMPRCAHSSPGIGRRRSSPCSTVAACSSSSASRAPTQCGSPARPWARGGPPTRARPARSCCPCDRRGEVTRIARIEGLGPVTPRTITDLDRLLDELDAVRRAGHAVDVEESVPGVSGVAAPVRLDGGMTVAALSVAVPTSRYETQGTALRRAVIDAADAISRDLRRFGSKERTAAEVAAAVA